MNNKDRIKAILTAAVMAAAPLAMNIPAASAEDYIVENAEVLTLFGDVNFDGKIDANDASEILSYYAFVMSGGKQTMREYVKTH